MAGRFESKVDFVVAAETRNVASLDDMRRKIQGVDKAASLAASSGLSSFASALSRFSGIIAGIGLFQLGRQTIEYAGQLQDASAKTGVATSSLGSYAEAAKTVGLSLGDVSTGLAKLNKSIGEAQLGNKETLESFAAFGISLTDLNGQIRPTDAIFEEFADKISSLSPEAKAAATALGAKVFGKSFAELIPLLEQGSQGLSKVKDQFSQDKIKRIDDYGDRIDKFTGAIGRMATAVLGEGLFALDRLNDYLATPPQDDRFGNSLTDVIGGAVKVKKPIPRPPTLPNPNAPRPPNIDDLRLKKAVEDKALGEERQRRAAEADRLAQQRLREQERIEENLARLRADTEQDLNKQVAALNTDTASIRLNNNEKERAKLLAEFEARGIGRNTELYNKLSEAIDRNTVANRSFEAGAYRALNSYVDGATNAAEAVEKVFNTAFSSIEDAFVSFTKTGKLSFADMTRAILDDLARIAVRQAITAPLASGLQSVLGSVFAAAAGSAAGAEAGGNYTAGGAASNVPTYNPSLNSSFADGGIMTAGGKLPLHRYAKGGIASRPQLALFGEGRMPEAYVPLPDGRAIPVTMQGAAGGQQNNVSVTVNVTPQGGQSTTNNQANNQQAAELGRMVSAVVTEELIKQSRPGGLLAR